jgi:hypothetical protein
MGLRHTACERQEHGRLLVCPITIFDTSRSTKRPRILMAPVALVREEPMSRLRPNPPCGKNPTPQLHETREMASPATPDSQRRHSIDRACISPDPIRRARSRRTAHPPLSYIWLLLAGRISKAASPLDTAQSATSQPSAHLTPQLRDHMYIVIFEKNTDVCISSVLVFDI